MRACFSDVNPLDKINYLCEYHPMSYDMIAVIRTARARRKLVLAMRKRNISFEAIGDELGVTRQRAQVIHREAVIEQRRNGK